MSVQPLLTDMKMKYIRRKDNTTQRHLGSAACLLPVGRRWLLVVLPPDCKFLPDTLYIRMTHNATRSVWPGVLQNIQIFYPLSHSKFLYFSLFFSSGSSPTPIPKILKLSLFLCSSIYIYFFCLSFYSFTFPLQLVCFHFFLCFILYLISK